MATLMPEGKQSFTNSTGQPLAGGKLYTYAAGTTTPKATFADADGTVPNTNPVILDARGEATIFWDGAYKVVLTDALDSVIWTVDGVRDVRQIVVDAIADTTAVAEATAASAASAAAAAASAAAAAGIVGSGRFLGVQTFTASGTYTPNAAMTFVIIELLSGGGGGAATTPTAGNSAVGGGGCGGGYLQCLLTRSQVQSLAPLANPLVVPVEIGAGGSGGDLVFRSGNYGGRSSFGVTSPDSAIKSPGAQGGYATVAYGAAGVVGGGTATKTFTPAGQKIMECQGEPGGNGFWSGGSLLFSGKGGSSVFGDGAPAVCAFNSNVSSPGLVGSGYGAGGSGAVVSGGGGAVGGNGTGGIVRIWEYA